MLRIKRGLHRCSFVGNPILAMAIAAQIANEVYKERGYPCEITSHTDGRHGAGSLHYVGLAFDVGVRAAPQADWQTLRDEISQRLGDEFDAVLEADHIHVEFQPKGPTKA